VIGLLCFKVTVMRKRKLVMSKAKSCCVWKHCRRTRVKSMNKSKNNLLQETLPSLETSSVRTQLQNIRVVPTPT
jgi:hypothetical protein